MKKTWILAAVLTVLLAAGGTAYAAAQTGQTEARMNQTASSVQNPDCDGTPALDGSGYQGGNQTVSAEESEVIEEPEKAAETVEESGESADVICPNPDCDGIPVQDGTGNQYGRNNEAGNGVQNRGETCANSGTCLNEDCDRIPNRDGTGLQKGKNR